VSNTAARRKLEEKCVAAIHEMTTSLKGAGSEALLELDLSMGQLKAMMALQAHGPQSVGRLGHTLGIAEPSASLLVDKLGEKGLVVRERDADDRRRTIVTPTDAGRDVTGRLQQSRDERFVELLAGLEDEELRSLCHALRGLARVAAAEVRP
jgi:DNA-binding MarR family transcriptional regulator